MTDQAPPMADQSFFGMLVHWIVSLPIDVKILIEMIGDNQLDMNARSLAVGTIAYLIAAIDIIPDTIPALGYVDDVLVLHIALAIILQIDPERAAYYREKHPTTIGAIDEQVQLVTDTLGALYSWLKAFVESLSRRGYKGQSAEEAAQSAETREEIFDQAMIFAAGVNVDEKAIRDRLLSAPPNQLVNMLSDGLEQEQKRQEKTKAKGVSGLLSASSSGVRRLLNLGKKG